MKKFITIIYFAVINMTVIFCQVIDGIGYSSFSTDEPGNLYVEHYYGASEDDDYVFLTIPEQVTYNGQTYKVTAIGSYAFSKCNNLIGITLPNSITQIGNKAFYSCSNLTNISLPNSITKIGDSAFANCTNLTLLKFPDGELSWNRSIYSGCTNLRTLIIGNGETILQYGTFHNLPNLENVIIPNSVTYIAPHTFDCHYVKSHLKRVVVPKNVNYIGEDAFNGVDTLIILAQTPPDLDYSSGYYQSPTSGKMFVACDLLNTYQNDNKWKKLNTGWLYGAVMDVQSKELSQGQMYNFDGDTIIRSGWYLHFKESDYGCDTIVCLKVIKEVDDEDTVSCEIDSHWASQITQTSARLNYSVPDFFEEFGVIISDELFVIQGGGLKKTIPANKSGKYIYANITGLSPNTIYKFHVVFNWKVSGYSGPTIDDTTIYADGPFFKTLKTYNGVGLENVEQIDLTTIYPNPANETVTVDIGNLTLDKNETVTIINNSGQVVYKSKIKSQKFNIDVSEFESGIYYVKVGNITKKLIVE